MIFGGTWYGREKLLGTMPSSCSNFECWFIWRVVKLFQNFGSVDKKHYSQGVSQKFTPPLELHLLHCVLMNPGIYQREIQQETTGTEVSPSAICCFFQRVGFSRQKLKLVAKQQDDFLRVQFSCDVAMYKLEMLIFLDETGSDKRNTLRKANLQYHRSFWCMENVSQQLHLSNL